MEKFAPSEGFGVSGLAVTDDGLNYRFNRPVSEVLLHNAGSEILYYGFNKLIVDAEENVPCFGAASTELERVFLLADPATALAQAIPLLAGQSITISSPIDAYHGRRGIYCLWLITAAGKMTTVHGGTLSM